MRRRYVYATRCWVCSASTDRPYGQYRYFSHSLGSWMTVWLCRRCVWDLVQRSEAFRQANP